MRLNDENYIQSGTRGPQVKRIQAALKELGYKPGGVDGIFGKGTANAVMAFQKANDLYDDGVVGQHLLASLNQALLNHAHLRNGSRGEAVRTAQEMLNDLGYSAGSEDGIFGGGTRRAVVAFQKDNGLSADGIVGPNTAAALTAAQTAASTEAVASEITFSEDEVS